MASVLTNADRARRSLSFGSEQGERPHSLTREVTDLRKDVELAFNRLEGGDGFPELLVLKAAALGGGGGNNKLKLVDDAEILGRNILAGRAQALIRIGDITYTAILPGTDGNSLAVKIVQGAGALSAAIANDVITITLAAANSTNDQVAAAVNANHLLKISAKVEANNGSNAAVAAQQSLAGGTGEGLSLLAYSPNGSAPKEINISTSIKSVTDSEIVTAEVNITSGNSATGDIVSLALVSHTTRTRLSIVSK